MGLTLKNVTKKVWDQVNMFDNGRTASHPAPTNNRSILGQATHNGLTNTVGNLIAKPLASTIVEPGRAAVGYATGNQDAGRAALLRFGRGSIPGQVVNQGINTGQAGYDLAFKAPVLDLRGKTAEAERARTAGIRNFNETIFGQATRPAQVGIANVAHADARGQAEVGLDPNATGAQKYFADPVMGAAAAFGLAKGGGAMLDHTAPKGKVPTVTKIAIDEQGKPVPVNVRVTKKVPVRAVPDHQELVDRYNTHMANLARKYGAEQKQVTLAGNKGIISEPSIYNDVGYQAEKQQIQQAFKDGTLGKTIPVTDAPPTKPTLTKKVTVAQPKGKPVVAAKMAEPDLTGLEPVSPYSSRPKSPGAFRRAWTSVNGVISRHGTGGEEIARRNVERRNASEIGQEGFIRQIPTVMEMAKKSEGDFETFVQTLDRLSQGERNITDVPAKVQQAIGEWKQAIPGIRDRAVQAGLDVGDLGEYYFPRQYKDLFKGDDKMRGMAQQLVDNGTAKNLGDAMEKLRFMRQEYTRPFGNLERTRDINLPGYEMTPEALTNYINRSFERITHAEQFGAKNETLNQLKDRMAQEGYDISPGSTLDKYLKIAFNDVDKQTTGHKVSRAIRQVNAFRSLGGAGISNATQLPVNTATIAGIGRTAKGLVKMATSKSVREEARDTGVLLDHSISDISKQQLGVSDKVTSNIASPFFRTVERFNRQATAIVGKDFGNAMAKKAFNGNAGAARMLEKIGVKGEIGPRLTREQEIQAARGLVNAAQFKVDPMDIPGFLDSPIGALTGQFRTFQYKQADFMYNYVLKEAFHGNFGPITRFVATGIPAGTIALAARSAMKGTNQLETNPDNNAAQNGAAIAGKALSQVGGPGLIGGSILNMMESAKYDNVTGGAAGLVGGPTASIGVETAQNIDKGIKGDWTKLGKEGIRQIPTVGPYAANAVFPKKEYAGDTQKGKKQDQLSIAEVKARDDEEKTKLEKDLKPGKYQIKKLPSGKFWYQVDGETKTTDDRNKAHDAIVKDKFKKSKDEIKIDDSRGTVYYKDSRGDIHTQDKALYDWNQQDSKDKLDMDRAYEAGSWDQWYNLAQKQYKALEDKKKFYNPETEQDKIDDITLQQENLQQKAEGYADKIANGKGFGTNKTGATSSGRKGSGGTSSGNVGSAYEYAVSPTSGSSQASEKPKVTSRRSSGGGRSVSRGSSKPKVSLKKSSV